MDVKFNWKLTVFSVFFTALFLYLGFWQVERGQEKKILILEDSIRRNSEGVGLDQLPTLKTQLEGLPVSLRGHFLGEEIFLLDNVVLNGKVGFEVLMLFEDLGGATVLVNRGFVAMGRTRSDLPYIPPMLMDDVKIRGTVHVTRRQTPAFLSQEITSQSDEQTLYIVQSGDPTLIGLIVGRALYPHLVRLAAQQPGALPRYWPVTTMKPVRHFSYAVTWFLMAAAVLVAFTVFTLRDQRET